MCTPKGGQPDGNITLANLEHFVYPAFAALTEDDMRVYARNYAASMIRFGTTTFEEPGCVHLDAIARRAGGDGDPVPDRPVDVGPRRIRSRHTARLAQDDHRRGSRALEAGLATVRAFDNPRILDAVTVEGVGTCSDELYAAAAELAKREDSLCVYHKATSEREVEMELGLYGHRPVQHMYEVGGMNEYVLMNHVTSLEHFEVDLFAETGARISQNPSSALKLSKGTTQTGKWPELLAAGVPIGLGTDVENASNHRGHLPFDVPRRAVAARCPP